MRYRTKSVEVEAYEFTGTIASAEQLQRRFPQAVVIGHNGVGDYDGRVIVHSQAGPMNLHANNYLVVESDGSLTILHHIAFAAKYERVVEAPAEATT